MAAKRVLVTGAGGFIGSHLVEELVHAGSVRALVHYNSLGTIGWLAEATFDSTRVRPSASEVGRLCADNIKAARLIGWKSQFAGRDGFRRGLEITLEWFRMRASVSGNLSKSAS